MDDSQVPQPRFWNDQQPNHFTSAGYPYQQDLYPKSSGVGQPSSTHVRTNELPQKSIDVIDVLPGTGSLSHNVTRMLKDTDQVPTTSSNAARDSPYSSANFLLFRHEMPNQTNTSTHEKDESNEQNEDNIPNNDMSISNDGSVSPGASSARSSPDSFLSLSLSISPSSVESTALSDSESSSNSTSIASPPLNSSRTSNSNPLRSPLKNQEQPKKKARTSYTNEQVQTLLKIFHENPYPDSETMENIGKDLGITEKNVKIWFQNKRARWRRRVNDNQNSFSQNFLQNSTIMSPASPYGFMPTGHMMTSSPVYSIHGYHPLMQRYFSQNNSHQLPVQSSTNQSKYQTANQSVALQNQAFPAVSMVPIVPSMSSAQYARTWSQQNMATNQNRQPYQFQSPV